ncbi:MAG: hypothetical protein ABSA47_16505 [Verrucomicrobiota bacterium]|jgi:type II secretory pathway pseudopilin PulG
MKLPHSHRRAALTLIEAIVVICVLCVLAAALFLPMGRRTSARSSASCLNNLHQIGLAYRIWDGDNGDKMPFQQPLTKGGWSDLLTNPDQGAICWTNYVLLSNDLGAPPRVVTCPSDERTASTNFTTDFKDNTHLSYFVGVSADDWHPQTILGGDRNLGYGPAAYRDYGYSPKNGKGNDVAIQTNSLFEPVSWSVKMHTASGRGCGMIILGDGSQRATTSVSFRQDYLSHADPTTNWPAGHAPATPSIRLIFP